jgi:hypothetical protein
VQYYMVPRMWLFGYDEEGKPLTHEQVMFEEHPLDASLSLDTSRMRHRLPVDWLFLTSHTGPAFNFWSSLAP